MKFLGKCVAAVVVVGSTLVGTMSSSEAAVQHPRVFSSGDFLGVSADSGSDAWAVGTFWDPAIGSLPLIGHWNGITWTNVEAPYPKHSFDDSLYSVSALSPNDAWAVGTYQYPGHNAQPLAEHWNGVSWTIDNPLIPVGSVDVDILSVSVVSSQDVWIAGDYEGSYFTEYTVVEHWNGHRWEIAKALNPSVKYDQNYLYGVSALPNGTVWAVGTWDSAKAGYVSLVEEATGRTWKEVPSPNSDDGYESILNSVDAQSEKSVWAIGDYAVTNVEDFPLSEHWDGQSWSIVPISAPSNATNSQLTSVSFNGKDEGLAIGYFQNGIPASAYFPLAESWNGSKWSESSPLIPNKSASTNLRSVAFAGKDSAWAVGGFSGTNDDPLIEHWNGRRWAISAT